MNQHQSEALTLRTYPYAESHKIVVFLTRTFGKLRGIAHGAKKPKSRFGASLETLTRLQVTFRRKEHQELAVIQNCEVIQVCPAYELSWEGNVYLGYFAELLQEFSREQEESENLFRLAVAVLDVIGQTQIEVLARYLEFWLLRLEGVLPRLEEKLPAELALKTLEMLKHHPSGLGAVTLTEAELKRLASLSRKLIEYNLEKTLKSWKLLRDLL